MSDNFKSAFAKWSYLDDCLRWLNRRFKASGKDTIQIGYAIHDGKPIKHFVRVNKEDLEKDIEFVQVELGAKHDRDFTKEDLLRMNTIWKRYSFQFADENEVQK